MEYKNNINKKLDTLYTITTTIATIGIIIGILTFFGFISMTNKTRIIWIILFTLYIIQYSYRWLLLQGREQRKEGE